MNDSYLYIIIALLPLTAGLLITQVNPYHALILRGVLGAIAALVDAVLGAADVALTEALMGTMLSVALYAIAVRSSLVLRLGVIENESISENLISDFRSIFNKHYMRLELVPYNSYQCLQTALQEKEVHATCAPVLASDECEQNYQTEIRVKRIYQIIESELSSPNTVINYVDFAASEEKH
ncbi:DUF4040 domain-containing protein [Sphaerospermopsis kisseleviana CS-549]|jgi:putative multicomponent Na+:H+ antiporter subunit B|uniref:DUF4040 domain-containing protein n=1 Tax=Sphaerospermopsis kisseleviana CS-549 TaxID=3021783 RepID=A0ABT4ZT37_9CYAN|nr:DUF4040 domain-containing protein [Sphaerospermopsis kisseleviana]MDB9442589.1 DUF4040 domain-containing protein [Sphaerospermopsis kisseleviana CS-549]BAZ79009.1 hypothetical protein NIES73_02480 [Sphaerospermopsis kisseleviana NIES-73]